MIVRDEEKLIARCLQSVEKICDEIVVVDTGSRDRTLKIARTFPGVRTLRYRWDGSFSRARNFAFAQAEGELLLWLDADDILSPEGLASLRALKRQPVERIRDCYYTPYHLLSDPLHGAQITHYRERVFKRSAKPRWKFAIHEVVQSESLGSVKYLDFPVWHFRPVTRERRSLRRNIRLLRSCLSDPQEHHPIYEFFLGRDLLSTGCIDEAETWFRQYLSHGVNFLEIALTGLARIAIHREQFQDAAHFAEAALEHNPDYAQAYCLRGEVEIRRRRWRESLRWYHSAQQLRKLNSMGIAIVHDYYDFIPHLQLSLAHYMTGEESMAHHHLKTALELRPKDPRARLQLELIRSDWWKF
jgi:glycosyltransferase involved in cell wall biosynthesis